MESARGKQVQSSRPVPIAVLLLLSCQVCSGFVPLGPVTLRSLGRAERPAVTGMHRLQPVVQVGCSLVRPAVLMSSNTYNVESHSPLRNTATYKDWEDWVGKAEPLPHTMLATMRNSRIDGRVLIPVVRKFFGKRFNRVTNLKADRSSTWNSRDGNDSSSYMFHLKEGQHCTREEFKQLAVYIEKYDWAVSAKARRITIKIECRHGPNIDLVTSYAEWRHPPQVPRHKHKARKTHMIHIDGSVLIPLVRKFFGKRFNMVTKAGSVKKKTDYANSDRDYMFHLKEGQHCTREEFKQLAVYIEKYNWAVSATVLHVAIRIECRHGPNIDLVPSYAEWRHPPQVPRYNKHFKDRTDGRMAVRGVKNFFASRNIKVESRTIEWIVIAMMEGHAGTLNLFLLTLEFIWRYDGDELRSARVAIQADMSVLTKVYNCEDVSGLTVSDDTWVWICNRVGQGRE